MNDPELDPELDLGPVLPYGDAVTGRSSGWSGSSTSRERAHAADADGTTSERQRRVVAFLTSCETFGATWVEVAERLALHHGQASGVLSNLHHGGRIARLTIRRGRCQIYVMPEFVKDRPVVEPGRNNNRRARSLANVEAVRDYLSASEDPASVMAGELVAIALELDTEENP